MAEASPARGARYVLERRGEAERPSAYEGELVLPDRTIALRVPIDAEGGVRVEAAEPLEPDQERLAKAFVRTALRSGEPPRRIVRWRG